MLAVLAVIEDPSKGYRLAYRWPPESADDHVPCTGSSGTASSDGVSGTSSGNAHGNHEVPRVVSSAIGGENGLSEESNEAMRTLNALCHDADGKTVARLLRPKDESMCNRPLRLTVSNLLFVGYPTSVPLPTQTSATAAASTSGAAASASTTATSTTDASDRDSGLGGSGRDSTAASSAAATAAAIGATTDDSEAQKKVSFFNIVVVQEWVSAAAGDFGGGGSSTSSGATNVAGFAGEDHDNNSSGQGSSSSSSSIIGSGGSGRSQQSARSDSVSNGSVRPSPPPLSVVEEVVGRLARALKHEEQRCGFLSVASRSLSSASSGGMNASYPMGSSSGSSSFDLGSKGNGNSSSSNHASAHHDSNAVVPPPPSSGTVSSSPPATKKKSTATDTSRTGPAAVAAVAAATAAAAAETAAEIAAAAAAAPTEEMDAAGLEAERVSKESQPLRKLPMATNLSLRGQTISSALANSHTTTDFEYDDDYGGDDGDVYDDKDGDDDDDCDKAAAPGGGEGGSEDGSESGGESTSSGSSTASSSSGSSSSSSSCAGGSSSVLVTGTSEASQTLNISNEGRSNSGIGNTSTGSTNSTPAATSSSSSHHHHSHHSTTSLSTGPNGGLLGDLLRSVYESLEAGHSLHLTVNGWLDLSVRLRRHARRLGESSSSSSSSSLKRNNTGGSSSSNNTTRALFFDGSFRSSLDGQLNDLRALRNVDPFEPSSTLRSPNLASHLQTHALRNAPHRYRRDFGGPHNNNSGGGGNSSNSISSLDGTSGGMNEGLDVSNSIGSGSSGSFRPFQTLLLLRDESDVVAALPPDSSHQLFALVRAANPLLSFRELSVLTGTPISQVHRLSAHLAFWGQAAIIDTVLTSNRYRMSSAAPLSPKSAAAVAFQKHFRGIQSLPRVLSFFRPGLSLADVLRDGVPPRSHLVFVHMLIWLLQHGLVEQIHPHVYLLRPLPPPSQPDTNQERCNGSSSSSGYDNSNSGTGRSGHRDPDSREGGQDCKSREESASSSSSSPQRERATGDNREEQEEKDASAQQKEAMNERLELHFRAVAQHLLSAGLSSSSSSSANLNSKGHGGRRGGNKSGSGSGGYGYEGVAEPVVGVRLLEILWREHLSYAEFEALLSAYPDHLHVCWHP